MKTPQRLEYLSEPRLTFGKGQTLELPKDGLFLFGPLQDGARSGALRYGVIGTAASTAHFLTWVEQIQGFVPAADSASPQHRPFPGFATVFGTSFPTQPAYKNILTDVQIDQALYITDRHQAIYKTVGVFAEPIRRYLSQEEAPIDVWFVVIPERVYKHGRPKSVIPSELRVEGDRLGSKKLAKNLLSQHSLFPEDYESAKPFYYEVNFHNQLKARLLEGNHRAVIQIVRDTTIAPQAFLNQKGKPIRKPQDPATVAWNLCTTAYFKAGLRPWRLAEVRSGVCYIGLVFKQLETSTDESAACCGAQMFLDSGDGMVFRGAVGPWRTGKKGEYHLQKGSAQQLISMVVEAYVKSHDRYPTEMFIHGKTSFSDAEWEGFRAAVPKETNLVGVRIRTKPDLRLFRLGKHPILRGTALCHSERTGYLWTTGYIPYLKTYRGRETPKPLRIDVLRGEASLTGVMNDVMGLTKLNFNACIYGDGEPVTLRFADSVGEILTAGPANQSQPPLPFKHYI
ncbi:MAG: hypothetical protein H0U97_05805 [Gammaproteobacteria bacterium]|nr:hypothetical protein [Gammaproteobacteria bacterium]